MIRKFTNNAINKTLMRIFFALILVTIIMFTSNFIVFNNSLLGMHKQISDNNRLRAKSIIRSFDECFKEVNNIIYSINMMPYKPFDSKEYLNIDIFNAYLIVDNIEKLVTQDYIEEIVIFYDDSDQAITSKGTIKFSDIIEERYINKKYAAEFWKNFSVTKHPFLVIPSTYYTENLVNGGTQSRKVMGIVGSNQLIRMTMNILVFVNEEKLIKHVNEQNMLQETSLIVLDENKNVILNTGNADELDNVGSVYFDEEIEKTVHKGKYEFYCVKSDYNGYVYIYKIPYNYEKVFNVVKINQIVLVLTLICGIIISVLLSMYLYKPIKNILQLIGSKGDEESQNKYKCIYNTIEKIQKENELVKTQIHSVEDEVRRSVFFKMIDDVTYYRNLRHQIDTYFKVIFYSKQFVMVSFYLEWDDKKQSRKVSVSLDNMANILQDIIKTKFNHSVVFHYENVQFIALIGLEDNARRGAVMDLIKSLVLDLKQATLFEYNIITAVSKFYTQVQDCKTAFKDIKMCLAYRSIKFSKTVIDAEKIDYTYEYYFPLDVIEKLSNYLLSGNSKESIYIINQIIDKNIENNINYIKFASIITDIFNNIINAMTLYGYDKIEILEIEREFFDKIDNVNNYEGLRLFLEKTIERVTEKIYFEKKSKLNKEFVIQYINLHYAENLYLENIAQILGTTPKYFSNFFKKTFGVNFVEYLNKIRISHAKEYLRNSNMQINELCTRVGFSHSKTFTRTFKKYCGVAPTEYRKEYGS